MTQKKFRRLVVLYIAFTIAGIAAAFLPSSYTQALSDALENEPTPLLLENLWLLFGLVLPLVAVTIAGMYGLFMFRRWGRTFSLCSTVAGLLFFPFLGPSLSAGFESMLYEAATLLWGAILSLSYCSAVAVHFGANNAK